MRPGLSVLLLSAFAAFSAQPGLAQQASVSGVASVIDINTIRVGGQTFRLAGVDGLSLHQWCYVDTRPWSCGAPALRALQTLVDGWQVECSALPGTDTSGVTIARCTVGGLDIAGEMVREGWAVAREGSEYLELTAQAKDGARGAWRGVFTPPQRYDRDIAQLEQRYRQDVVSQFAGKLQSAMTSPASWTYVFDGFGMGAAAPDQELAQREVALNHLADKFIDAAIPERAVFSWRAVADRLASWMESSVMTVKADAIDVMWDELRQRPSTTVITHNGHGYLTAMQQHAAQWIAAGRQPVLLIRSPLVPSWIREWFGDEPPVGVSVQKKGFITAPGYMGTVGGIDIYVADVPDNASALMPSDMLKQVYYAPGAGADAGFFATSASADQTALSVRYAIGFDWRDDPIVWIQYPIGETEILVER